MHNVIDAGSRSFSAGIDTIGRAVFSGSSRSLLVEMFRSIAKIGQTSASMAKVESKSE